MIFPVMGGALFLIVSFCFLRALVEDEGWAIAIICYTIPGIVLGGFALMIASFGYATATPKMPYPTDHYYVTECRIDIENVSDRYSTSGRGRFRHVVIQTNGEFSFYKDNGDHFTLDSIPANKTKVVYSDDPRIEYLNRNHERHFALGSFHFGEESSCDRKTAEFILYVPEGSIGETFELNAE